MHWNSLPGHVVESQFLTFCKNSGGTENSVRTLEMWH